MGDQRFALKHERFKNHPKRVNSCRIVFDSSSSVSPQNCVFSAVSHGVDMPDAEKF